MSLSNPRFEDSYGRLFGPNVAMEEDAEAFFLAFYTRFLKAPGVAKFFASTDMNRQVKMMKQSLFQLVSYYVTNSPSAELKRLAAMHVNLAVESDFLEHWLEALIATVAEKDPFADEATQLAWCWALTPGITYFRMVLDGSIAEESLAGVLN